MDLMLQTLKVPRKPLFLGVPWNYLQRYLSIQDVLENCCFQAMAKKFVHCLIKGMRYYVTVGYLHKTKQIA